MELRAGQRIDHYTLIEPVGEGGQGAVWKVHDPRDGGVVRALKLIALAETGAAGFERARREARILATLEHPALVRCHGLFEDPRAGLVGLVMDLAPGQSLADALAGGRLDRPRALAVLIEIAGALAYLHGAGLAHRDLKPDNVVVTDAFWDDPPQPGTVKLIDFGIAAPAGDAGKLTAVGVVVGTLPYLPPELVDPASWGRAEGPARDVFAFGVMAYELWSGRRPTGLGPNAAMIDYARAYKAAEAQRIPWPPPGLEGTPGAFIARCLALRPSDRPRDGAAIVELLRTGAAPKSAVWSGIHGTTAPHGPVTEPSPGPPVMPPPVEKTAPMPLERTIPAAPVPEAVTVGPVPRKGCAITVVASLAALLVVGGGATAAWYAFVRPADPTVDNRTPPAPPAPVQVPTSSGHGACCRDDTCERRLSRFTCPLCSAEPPPMPRRTWSMRIGGVTDHLSADKVCVEVAGSNELCVPYSHLPDATGAGGRLPVTTDDIEAGRVFFTFYAGDVAVARGYGRRKAGTTHFLVSALCMGLTLHVAVPRQDDVVVRLYLDDR